MLIKGEKDNLKHIDPSIVITVDNVSELNKPIYYILRPKLTGNDGLAKVEQTQLHSDSSARSIYCGRNEDGDGTIDSGLSD